jgi:hypothetical protein
MRDPSRRWWERPGLETYNQSMHLDHCLRPPASVVAFADRSGAPVR